MIGGTIVYKSKYIYNIKASDTSSVFSFVIQSNNERAIMEMCDPAFQSDEYPDILWERAGEINLSKVVVQTGKYTNEKGKLVNIPCNKELFCRLGALISYVKTQCRVTNEVGYTGLSLASGEFEAKSVREYVIAEPLTDEVFAEVSMSFGAIVRLSLKATDFEIELDTVGSEQLFTKPKGAWSSGFRFTKDYLGFDIAPPALASISTLGGLYETLDDVIAAHPDKDLYWLRGKAYSIVKDENLAEVCDYIKSKKRVYFDTETTGLNITFLSRSGQGDQCVGLILSVKFGESFFFPLQMKRVQNLCGGDHFYVMEHYIREILEGCDIVAHNASFDWKTAYIYDINTNIVDDTMAMIRLTYGSEKKNYPIDLKNSSKLILGRDSLELSDLVVSNDWGEGDIRFWDLTEELTKYYACADTDNTMGIDLYFKNNDILAKYNAQKVYEIEVAFSLAVGYQEFYGHHIDVHNLETMREAIGKTMEKLMAQMEEIVGHKFNPNSSVQLKQVMYQELGIPEQIDRATGKVTTNKEALKRLSEIENIDGDGYRYPFCRLLSEYRENEGVRKIVDKFPEIMSPDGYIFPSVYQYGTETGRVSIHDPNYQSYNNPVKKHVIPRPGYYMTDTDYSSIEYRVLASMVRNQRIMKSFEDPDFDYHRYQAAHINRVPYAAVTKKMRKEAKGINFGLPYGMGDESLGARVFGEATPENTRRAASLRSAYFKGQEDIRDWFEFHRDRGVNEGFTETYFGRRRYYRKTDFTEKAIRRQAGNQVIQGCQSLQTRILTREYGIVELGDVLGQNVTIWNGVKWTTGDVLPAGNKRKTIIKFKGGQVKICSPEHKFLVSTKRGGTMWVEAQYLHTTSEYRNPHRVVVNQNYDMPDHVYTSERKYDSVAHNSNNVYLADINDSYEIGLFLGRLASDGHQTLHHAGSNAVEHVVAEHEYNILPQLRACMENLHYYEDNAEVRKDRNEALTRMTVYSTSLSREIDDLDIRHKIHKNIFMDMEVLRGFLCGYFDGDGGISGKTITCVFGKQDDFRTLVEDMQIALMFFGVRSRIREYEDRYVLQIKTNDNEVFLKEIGFLNSDKQIAGCRLYHLEEEKTFGKCIIPEYVEVTDEYIPMADVCNTEDGYYVADGIITHNTAADCYKLAVGRVFQRICREGWLGKVLLTGFIHDELLAEVSVDIDPMVWLKSLREEFEISVNNEDGSSWCPLYMGFGWGRNWYEAKSVEVPIRMQWELVEKYGSTGIEHWDGDYVSFCNKVPGMIHDFEVRDTIRQLLDTESQGQEIKPALNSMVLDLVSDAAKRYPGDEFHTLYDSDGNELAKFVADKTTQGAITQFCVLYGVDRSKVNLLDIKEEAASSGATTSTLDMGIDLDEEDPEQVYRDRMNTQCMTFGFAVDTKGGKFVIKYTQNSTILNFIKKYCHATGDFKLVFRNFDTRQDFPTRYCINSSDVNVLAMGISKASAML